MVLRRPHGATVLAVLLATVWYSACVHAHAADQTQLDRDLYAAAEKGNLKAAKNLLQQGADPNARIFGHVLTETPFGKAISDGRVRLAEAMLEYGANPYLEDEGRRPALVHAARTRREDMVRLLLAWKVPINSVNSQGQSALLDCVGYQDRDVVPMLLKLGADPNQRNSDGSTPIMGTTDPEVIRALVKHGADPNAQDKEGMTALLKEMTTFDARIAPLLEAGADINLRDKKGRNAFLMAVESGHPLVKSMIDRGADVHATEADGTTALMGAAGSQSWEIVNLLLERGLDPSATNRAGKTVAHFAAGAGHHVPKGKETEMRSQPKAILELLISKGASLHARDENGRTPLFDAVISGYMETVRFLLAQKLDPNLPSKDGTTLLQVAIELVPSSSFESEKAHLLISLSTDIDKADQDGRTALYSAVSRRDRERIQRLLKHGACPDRRTQSRNSPLLLAAESSHSDFVSPAHYSALLSLLAARSKDVDQQNADGMTALMWAAASDVPAAVEALLTLGAKLDPQSNDGRTALMWAAAAGAKQTIPVLLHHGADRNVRDKEGRTAADWAKWMRQKEVIAVLEAK